MPESAMIRSEKVAIPTYRVGSADKNPMFLEKRVYQGSSGVLYPYPMIESVSDEPVEETYDAFILENEYLEVMVLPQLGGRIQRARDKTNNYDFIYHNRVIKPALVGLAGPWISGGIEFNWPQHHRPNTFGPVAARRVRNADGSETVWCGETDRMYGSRGLHGVTIHPGRAVMEIHGRVYNPTALPQTFLWWANPAVSVHEDYQSIFPPDVTAVMDHGKRDVSTFPVATGTYYKIDYRPGTDISWYGNIPVPTSYMAYKSNFDFVGGYDHRRRAGLLHVADHHVSPGKKQWTWGCGDFGQAWDRNLTDGDGPYFELMTGVYTDNQPDFSWLMPCEEKRFLQTFYPYQRIGHVRKANTQAAVSLDLEDGVIRGGVYLTSSRTATVVLKDLNQGSVLYEETMELSPAKPCEIEIKEPAGLEREHLELRVYSADRPLIQFSWKDVKRHPVPTPADPAPTPREVATNEELVLWGRHLDQYRHATRDPIHWLREAIRRDPMDMHANNEMGKLMMKRGRPDLARPHFESAVSRALSRNPNPYDGEPLYNLGVCLFHLQDYELATDCLAKSEWNAAWKTPASLVRARIHCIRGEMEEAVRLLRETLQTSGRAHSARELLLTALRHAGHRSEALSEIGRLLHDDPVNPCAVNELRLLGAKPEHPSLDFLELFGRDADHHVLELVRRYNAAGFKEDALELVATLSSQGYDPSALCLYHLGRDAEARTKPIDGLFPNRLEDILLLKRVVTDDRHDGKAWHLLGNALYDKKQHDDAIDCWQRAAELLPDFPTTHRNLGLALFNKRGDQESARRCYERALAIDTEDARVFFEYDQLLKRMGEAPASRLEKLTARSELLALRDDLYLECATLRRLLGDPEGALEMLLARKFHPWEGGEGKVTRQYVLCLQDLATAAIEANDPRQALELLDRTREYPGNLSEGKLHGTVENETDYLRGIAHELLDEHGKARSCFTQATRGLETPSSAWFYNDQPPESIFFQGLAFRRLKDESSATKRFESLLAYGRDHLEDKPEIDFFAVSLPDFLVFEDDLEKRNRVHCHLMMALGLIGLERRVEAREQLESLLALDPSHEEAQRRLHALDGEASR